MAYITYMRNIYTYSCVIKKLKIKVENANKPASTRDSPRSVARIAGITIKNARP